MISTEECLYLLDQKLNALSTNANQFIPIEDKLLALNEACIESVISKIDLNNVYHLGFEAFRKRYQDLQSLIKPHEELSLIISDNNLHKYSASLIDLSNKYLLYADIYILADKLKCLDRVLAVNIIKHSDLQLKLHNKNTRPSFEYQETVGLITDNNLEIFTDGSFEPKTAHISYLTYPAEMDFEGYIKLNGDQSTTVNSDLPEYMKNEIVAIATRKLAGPTGNINAVNLSQAEKQYNS